VLALAPRAGEDGLCSALAEEGAALLGARAAALVMLPAAEGADVDVALAGAPPRRGAAARFAEVAAFAAGGETHRIVRNAEVTASGYDHVLLVALGGRLRGVLSVAYWRRARLTGDDLETLATFAELAAVAFGNAHRQAGLEEATRTDPLTGCLNHAALHERLARRPRHPLRGRRVRARGDRRRRGRGARDRRARDRADHLRPRRPARRRTAPAPPPASPPGTPTSRPAT
jgi:hypothetical protein